MPLPNIVIVLVGALAVSHLTLAQRPTLRLSTTIGEYYGTIYVPPPQKADHTLLRGEPLKVRINVTNVGGGATQVTSRNVAPFRVRVSAIDTAVFVPEVSADTRPTSRGPGRVGTGRLPARLQKLESLHWDVTIPAGNLPAGHYRIVVESELTQALDVYNDAIVIEIRDVTGLAERVELLRIAATRAMRNADFPAVEAGARDLIAAHPQSAFGYILLGDAAAGRRDAPAAREAYTRAAGMLKNRSDSLYTAVASEHSIREMLETIAAKLLVLNNRSKL